MMIFISYNHRDSNIVEPIAVELKDIFGQDAVFYDKWSIRPGDSIVGSMDEALEKCGLFLFFISKNSIDSNMVKLEWQTALNVSTDKNVRFVPVRLDESKVPTILSDRLWLDAYTNGIPTTTRQIIDIANNKSTFRQEYSLQNNLNCTLKVENDKKIVIEINAIYTIEPISSYLILLKNPENEISVAPNKSVYVGGYNRGFKNNLGEEFAGWTFEFTQATTPNFPIRFDVRSNTDKKIDLVGVYHRTSEDGWTLIPTRI